MQNKHHVKAYALFKEGKLQKALEFYNRAIGEEPGNADIYCDRGVLFYHLKEKMRSLDDMNTAVKLDPDYSYRYSSRAYIKDWIGDTEGAVEDYRIAVKLDPEDAIAFNNLGLLEEKLGYKQMAQERYTKADKLAEAENKLMQKIAELEKGHVEDEPSGTDTPDGKGITESKDLSKARIIKGVLTDRKQFREFLRFIRNGFKA